MDSYVIAIYFLLITLVVGLFTFVIVYMIGSDWRRNLVGRYVMYFMATIAGTFAYILFSPLLRDVYGKKVIDLAILLLLNFGAWKLTWLLRKIQKGKYDESTKKDIR